jgi:uncharacterized protein
VNGFLLDTHVLLWFIQKDPQLSDRAREVIVDDANLLFLSIASLWEITVKINDSDIDVLIDYEQAPTLFKLVNLRDYLKELTGLSVDVVTKNGLKPRIRDQVLSEVIYL